MTSAVCMTVDAGVTSLVLLVDRLHCPSLSGLCAGAVLLCDALWWSRVGHKSHRVHVGLCAVPRHIHRWTGPNVHPYMCQKLT
jgi:hypothetical protein